MFRKMGHGCLFIFNYNKQVTVVLVPPLQFVEAKDHYPVRSDDCHLFGFKTSYRYEEVLL